MLFQYPAFLFALAALAIPIIIHLFYFRRFKTVYFTNVRFLKEVKEETSARQKLRNLLVLLMRCLAVAALVFAFAQPFIPKDVEVRQGQKLVSVFVDNSFSMRAMSEDVPLLEKAKQRLAFNEMLILQLKNQLRKLKWQNVPAVHQKPIAPHPEIQDFIEKLPSQLTTAQLEVLKEIQTDLGKIQPMFRLVQGDVGSGKTIVAAIAAFQCILQGYQTALMAPTEILAEQHFQTLSKLFSNPKLSIDLLTGSLKKKAKHEI